MNLKIPILTALWCTLGAAAAAAGQQPAPEKPPAKPNTSSAQAEAGEPRADTSTPAVPEPAASADGASSAPTPRAAPTAPGEAPAPKAGRSAPAKAASADKGPVKNDRLDLGLATVTGDHEQPKVLYIVPWKRSDIGDLQGKPMNSLVDEILSPVDRDVFKREVIYYKAVQADTSQNGAQPTPAPKGEK